MSRVGGTYCALERVPLKCSAVCSRKVFGLARQRAVLTDRLGGQALRKRERVSRRGGFACRAITNEEQNKDDNSPDDNKLLEKLRAQIAEAKAKESEALPSGRELEGQLEESNVAMDQLQAQMDNSLWRKTVDSMAVSTSFLEAKQALERKKEIQKKVTQAGASLFVGVCLLFHEQLLYFAQSSVHSVQTYAVFETASARNVSWDKIVNAFKSEFVNGN